MDDQKLNEIIQELELLNKDEDAYFGIQQHGGGTDESYVQGNKEGLIRFAKELLKASSKTEETDGKIIHIFEDDEWIDDMSEVGIDYIEKVDISNDFRQNERTSNQDNIFGGGCILVLLLIVVLAIVGIITVFSWF